MRYLITGRCEASSGLIKTVPDYNKRLAMRNLTPCTVCRLVVSKVRGNFSCATTDRPLRKSDRSMLAREIMLLMGPNQATGMKKRVMYAIFARLDDPG